MAVVAAAAEGALLLLLLLLLRSAAACGRMASVAVAASGAALEAWLSGAAARCDVGVIYFFAEFHQACRPGGQMDQVTALLQQRHAGSVEFIKVDAEAAAEAAEAFGVQMVPSFVVLRRGTKVDLVEGAVPSQLQAALERHLAAPKQQLSTRRARDGRAARAAGPALRRLRCGAGRPAIVDGVARDAVKTR